MYTLVTTAISVPKDLVPDATIRKVGSELIIGLQTTQSYPLVGVSNGSVQEEGKAVASIFCNESDKDIAINYLDFSSGSDTWIYAYVQAGRQLAHIVRAVKTVTGNFEAGQMLRF